MLDKCLLDRKAAKSIFEIPELKQFSKHNNN